MKKEEDTIPQAYSQYSTEVRFSRTFQNRASRHHSVWPTLDPRGWAAYDAAYFQMQAVSRLESLEFYSYELQCFIIRTFWSHNSNLYL